MKNIKRFLILCLTCMASFCLLIGVSIANAVSPVNAESGIVRQDGLVVDGLSVRIGTASDSREGVRFHIGMSLELYDSLLNDEKTGFKDGVTTGTLIIGTSKKSGDLTVDTQGASNADTTNNWFAIEDEQGNVSMQSVVYVYNIPASQYGTNLSVVGYVNNNGAITYSDEVSRSMSWVAEKELNDPNSTFDQDMKDKLQAAYLNKTVTLYDGTTEEIKTVTYGNTLSVEDPTKNGYTFNGWYNQAGTHEWDMATKVTNPIKLYANWIRNAGYEILDDFYGDLSNYEFYHAKVGAQGSAVDKYTAQYSNGGLFLDYSIAGNFNDIIHFKHITADKYNHFDYITIKGNVNVNRTGFRISLWGNNEILDTLLENVMGDFTYVIPKKHYNVMGDYLKIHTGNYTNNLAQSLTITSITGGYDSVYAESEINLVEKTGFTASELAGSYFENDNQEKTTISNLTAFTPSENGKIVLTLNVKGYASSNVEILVNSIKDFNELEYFDNNMGKYSTHNATLSILSGSETEVSALASYSRVLKATFNKNGGGAYISVGFNDITSQVLNRYDYITITCYINTTAANAHISYITDDNNTKGSNILSSQKGLVTYTINTADITTSCLRLGYTDWTGSASNSKLEGIYILDITGGYDSVCAEDEINFEEKFGLTATELAGSYFENASGEKTYIEDFNVFKPTEQGKLVVKINVIGYKATTYEIEVLPLKVFGQLENFEGDMSKYYIYDSKGTNKQGILTTVSGSETGISALSSYNKALKAEFTWKQAWGEYISVAFYDITSEVLAKYDYITVTVYIDTDSKGTHIVHIANDSNARGDNILTDQKGLVTYTIKTSEIATSCLRLGYRDYSASSYNQTKLNAIYILGIVGEYNAVITEQTVNIAEKTGLTASELTGTYFENENGKQTTISDLTAFVPTEKGKIVLNINKQGYKSTSPIEIEVIDYPKYNNLETFDGDMSKYSIFSKEGNSIKTATLTTVRGSETNVSTLQSYGKILKAEFDYKGGYGVYMSIGFNNITSAVLSNFDYITITCYADTTHNTGVTAVIIKDDNNTRGDAIMSVKGLVTYTLNTSEIETSCLRLGYRDYSGSGTTQLKAIYVLGITGGYNDVTVGESINLVEKTGLTEAELAGTYFEDASGVQTPISDLTAFVPTEAGTIKFVITKEGYKSYGVTINVVEATTE